MLKINFKNNKVLAIIIQDLFLAFLVLFLIFSLLELLKPRIITNYINLNIFLLLLILLGVIAILFQPEEKKEIKKLNFLDYSTIILFCVLVGVLIFYLIRAVGILSILIGIASAIISCFFIILIYKND